LMSLQIDELSNISNIDGNISEILICLK